MSPAHIPQLSKHLSETCATHLGHLQRVRKNLRSTKSRALITCDDDADFTVPGVVKSLTVDEYANEQQKENDTKAMQVRERRDWLLRTEVDSYNPMRWESLTAEQQNAIRVYRQALLDITAQPGFPWTIEWPEQP